MTYQDKNKLTRGGSGKGNSFNMESSHIPFPCNKKEVDVSPVFEGPCY